MKLKGDSLNVIINKPFQNCNNNNDFGSKLGSIKENKAIEKSLIVEDQKEDVPYSGSALKLTE